MSDLPHLLTEMRQIQTPNFLPGLHGSVWTALAAALVATPWHMPASSGENGNG